LTYICASVNQYLQADSIHILILLFQQNITTMKNELIIALIVMIALSSDLYGQMPANGEAGKCYAKCLILDQYETVTEQVLQSEAITIDRVAVPTYETVTEKVMVKPASVRFVAVPAVYETVTEQVLSKEASTRIVPVAGKYESVTNSNIYSGNGSDGLSSDMGDILNPANPNSPNKAGSPYNPNTPGSISNINDPNNPYNSSSPYYGSNINSTAASNGANSNTGIDDGFLASAQVGTILPYIEQEASVSIDRVPFMTETETEQIEVSPASTKWVKKKADRNCLSADPNDCLVWCYVEVPAQYRTISRTVNKGCPAGYHQSSTSGGSNKSCVKVNWTPAKYGSRKIMTEAPRYETVEVPAEYQTVTKRVLSTPATIKKVVVPAEYKTVSRKVRKGLKAAGMVHPTGTMLVGANGGSSQDGALKNPVNGSDLNINPMAGYPLDEQYTAGDAAIGDIDHSRINPSTGGVNASGTSAQSGYWNAFYTSGCPSGYNYDPVDNLCKTTETIPAKYTTISKRVLATPGGFSEWREVVCADNITSDLVRRVQSALISRGYNVGDSGADNQLGAATKAALVKFQRDNGLPVGQLDFETLKALGVRQ